MLKKKHELSFRAETRNPEDRMSPEPCERIRIILDLEPKNLWAYNICDMEHIDMQKIAGFHRALSDPMRIKIMRLLMERELCVCEVVRSLNEPQYKVSKHIAVLKQAGLVRDWREGTWIHYELSPKLSPEWQEALASLRNVWDKNRDVQAALRILRQKVPREAGGPVTSCECE